MSTDDEQWSKIEGYGDKYEVSTFGNIKSLRDNNGNIRNTAIFLKKCGTPYYRVIFCINGTQKNFSIHRLVALSFIPNPYNKPHVNHKDGNKLNNHVSNLEWCTAKENIGHSFQNGLQVIAKGDFSKLCKPINQLSENGYFIKYWDSIEQSGNALKIRSSNISRCCRGHHKTCGGYKWEYAHLNTNGQPITKAALQNNQTNSK